MALNRESFLRSCGRRYDVVSIPGLGDLRLQSLTQAEMRAIRGSLRTKEGEVDKERFERLDQILVAATVVDDDGVQLFTDDDAMGMTFDSIDGGPWAVLTAAVKRHTGWAADEDWQPVRAAAKN